MSALTYPGIELRTLTILPPESRLLEMIKEDFYIRYKR